MSASISWSSSILTPPILRYDCPGCSWRSCHVQVDVLRYEPATRSALAHELAHVISDRCGFDWNEQESGAFAAEVNALAAAAGP